MKCSFVGGKTPLAHLANRFSVSWMEGVFLCFFSKEKHGFLNKSVHWGDSMPTHTINIRPGVKDLICVSKRWLAAVEKMHQKSCNFWFLLSETVFLFHGFGNSVFVRNSVRKYIRLTKYPQQIPWLVLFQHHVHNICTPPCNERSFPCPTWEKAWSPSPNSTHVT